VEESEEWLLFDRSIPLPDNNNEVKVELAFRFEKDNKTEPNENT